MTGTHETPTTEAGAEGVGARTREERVLEELAFGVELTSRYDFKLLGRLWPHLKPHARLLWLSLLLVPLTSLAALVQPYLIKQAIDAVLLTGDMALWGRVVGLYGVVLAAEFALRFAQMYSMQLAGQRSLLGLRRDTFLHAQRVRVAYYDRTPIGRVLTRVTNDVDSLGELYSSGAVMAVADVTMLGGIVAFMLVLDWQLSLVTFAALPPLALAVEWIRRRARQAFRDIRTRIAQLNAYLSEQVQGMQVVQAFGRESASADEYRIINDAHRRANYRAIRYDAALFSLVESISIVCVALVLWYAAQRATGLSDPMAATAYVGTMVAFYQYIQQFFVPIRDLSTKYTIIQSSLAAAERIFGFLDVAEVERDAPGADATGAPDPAADPVVRFERVSFGYRPGDTVLSEIDFAVRPGESIAIVGATGAGKTSVISLLLRLYDIQKGAIRVGGVDADALSRRTLRRMFSVVPQDVFLFSGTVADNVALEPEPDEDRVKRALERVGALELVMKRAGGLSARVDERGANFSLGERQLLAFARALYRDAPLLILDEATANIDSETEARLQLAMDELMRDRTSIAIAHRLSTIRRADRILVFHKGRIVEQGSHEELLERGQVYARLHQLQFGEP